MDNLILLGKNIALALKYLREKNGWSLDMAARETSVSKAMLGKIEREESSPTISTLMKIATGFNVSLSVFIDDNPLGREDFFYMAKEEQKYQTQYDKLSVTTIFPFHCQTKNEVLLITLQPGYEHLSPMHTIGLTEQIIVKKGILEVLIKSTWYIVKQGEGIRFHADQPHGYKSKTSKGVEFYNIMTYPEGRKTIQDE